MGPGGRGYIRMDFPHKDTIEEESWTYGRERCRERGRKGNGRKDGRKEGKEDEREGEEMGKGGRGREGGTVGGREGRHGRIPPLWCQLSCGIPAVAPVQNQVGTAPSEMQFRA